jgi:sugar phosphate permease
VERATVEPREANRAPRRQAGTSAGRLASRLVERVHRATDPFVRRRLGGRRAAAAVLVLAIVLALDSADRSSLGALAPSIRAHFDVSNTDIGVLAAAFSIVGGLSTVPIGALTDRVNRVHLLALSVVTWSVAMVVTGFAVTFLMLFAARLVLGVVTATGGPTVSSLTGDLYAPGERGRMLGWIRGGELIGAGVGFLLAGAAAALFGWRGVFFVLAAIGFAVAVSAWRLHEPARGYQGGAGRSSTPGDEAARGDTVGELVHEAGVEPAFDTVLGDEADTMSLREVMRYVLRVRTNVIVIIASAIGDFFFAGLQLFAVEFVVHRYGIGKYQATVLVPIVGIGALVGILLGGHLTDGLLRRGHLTARITVSALAFIVGAVVLTPAFLSRSLAVALPLFVLGAVCLAVPNPPLDAARLDVIDPRLWGRAEGVRTLFRIGAQAIAPLTFGLLADELSTATGGGLDLAFLVMLPMLVLSGAVLLVAQRTYSRDVASAQLSGEQAAST